MGSTEVLQAGSVFAESFRIAELLADGDMGAAYLADALPTGARCVLKVLDPILVKHEAIRRRFVGEARATSRVDSEYLLQTRGAGIDRSSGRPWLVTDVLEGEDLATRVHRWGSQSWSDVLTLVAALGDALGKAHAQGLVHYDLTPENIHLIAGKPFGVVLRELTISRLVSDACAAEGDVFGSASWMPPEQFDLGRGLAPSANVWSLGLLAFYAATGHAYWLAAANDPSPSRALLREILAEPFAPPSERARALGCETSLPAWFDRWFLRCLVRDPSRRPGAAQAAQDFLAEHGDQDRPHESTRPVEDDQRPTRRPPPPATRVKRSRSLPRGVLAEAKSTPPAAAPNFPSPAPITAPASPGSKPARRPARTWRYVAMLAVGAALLAWFRADRPAAAPQPTNAAAGAPSERAIPATSAAIPLHTAVPQSTVVERATAPAVATPAASAPDAGPARRVVDFPSVASSDTPGVDADYDLAAALKAVNRVYYGSCSLPSSGKLAITFAPSGRVKKVTVLQGDYDEPTTACIAGRFGTAKMAPFQGNAQTVTASVIATK
jgi:serine/threonine-protein kinase